MTVARSRTRGGDRELRAAVAALDRFASDPWTPDEVVCWSVGHRSKPTYEVIARPLTRRRLVGALILWCLLSPGGGIGRRLA